MIDVTGRPFKIYDEAYRSDNKSQGRGNKVLIISIEPNVCVVKYFSRNTQSKQNLIDIINSAVDQDKIVDRFRRVYSRSLLSFESVNNNDIREGSSIVSITYNSGHYFYMPGLVVDIRHDGKLLDIIDKPASSKFRTISTSDAIHTKPLFDPLERSRLRGRYLALLKSRDCRKNIIR